MPRVAPFAGLMYDPTVAGPLDRLTAPPYDVISDSRRRSYLDGSAHNIVHLDLAEGNDDPAAPDSRYTGAAELLRVWLEGGVLGRTVPSYFAYEVRFLLADRERTIRGVFCALQLEPWGGAVMPHEEVMDGPIQDRLSLLRATRTHLSAIYGTVAGPVPGLAEHLDRTCRSEPLLEVIDGERVRHRMWRLPAETPVQTWLAGEPMLIADGHHRYTTALAYRDERRAADGPGPWDRILTLIVDAGAQEVPVLPYHRVQLAGSPPAEGVPVADLGAAQATLDDDEGRYATVSRGPDGRIDYRVHQVEGPPPTVRALHDECLDLVASGDALRFTHDAGDADEMVRTGQAVAAYLLPPTRPDRILAAIERGERLPRKSTFFWPKPRTGMVLMPLDDALSPRAAPPVS